MCYTLSPNDRPTQVPLQLPSCSGSSDALWANAWDAWGNAGRDARAGCARVEVVAGQAIRLPLHGCCNSLPSVLRLFCIAVQFFLFVSGIPGLWQVRTDGFDCSSGDAASGRVI